MHGLPSRGYDSSGARHPGGRLRSKRWLSITTRRSSPASLDLAVVAVAVAVAGQPQRSAMFQKAGGLPSLPRRMTPMSGDPDWDEDWGSEFNAGAAGLAGLTPAGTGEMEARDELVPVPEESDPELPDEPEIYDEPGGIEDEGIDVGGYEEDTGPPDIGGDDDDWVGGTLEEYPDPSDYLSADEPSELDALFEDIIEGLESDIPEVRQNAMNEMNAALRRQAEINSIAGRGIGGGFGGAMGATTARGMEALARSEMDARNRVRQAQLGWLDRRLRQQGLDESEERDMKMAFLDMIKDIDPDTLMETYGSSNPIEIIDQLFGGGDGGGDFSGAGGDTASDTPFYESASEPMLGDTTSEDDYRYDEANGMYSIEGLERNGNPVQLRYNQVRGGFENLSYALQDMQLEAFDNVDVDTQALMQTLSNPNSELGKQVITYYLHYYAENGTVPSGEDTYSYLEQVGLDADFRELVLALS